MSHERLSGRAKSCTNCRQVKLACDARRTFPSPCGRCQSKSLECKLDSSFQRVPARRRLEEMTTQLNQLRAVVQGDDPASSTQPSPDGVQNDPYASRPSHLPQISFSAISLDLEGDEVSPKWLDIDDQPDMEPKSLGIVTLEPGTILDLLSHFDHFYFRHIPVLEPVTSVSALHLSTPILFWTIILVASQWHPTLSYLYHELGAPHQLLLSTILSAAIHSTETVHALLLLCLWPIPKTRHSEDPSWNYTGLAITAAMQLGLHHPLQSLRDVGPMIPKEPTLSANLRAMTWLACFNINVQIGCFQGLPPNLCSTSQLDQIASICRVARVPRAFALYTEIHRHIGRYTTQLDGLQDNRAQHSLILLFDRELEALRSANQDIWSNELDVTLQTAKLYLYALCFTTERSLALGEFGVQNASASFKLILNQGLTAATRLIYKTCEMDTRPDTDTVTANSTGSSGLMIYYPKPYFTATFLATIFLLKYLVAQPHAAQADRELAINHVTISHQLFAQFKSGRDHVRAALLIELLGRMTRSEGGHPDVRVKTRLGASIVYDAMYSAYRIRTRRANVPANSSAWIELTDLGGLPPAPEQLWNNQFTMTGSSSSESPDLSHLQADQGWTWGMWDDSLFDSLAQGTAFEDTSNLSLPSGL